MSRSSFSLLIVSFLSLLLVALAPPAARGDDPTIDSFVGRWSYASGEAGQRRVDEAIEWAVSPLPPIIEGIAARRIEASVGPFQRLEFRYDGRRLTFSADDWGPNTSVFGGGASPIEGPAGATLQLTQQMTDDGQLMQRFVADDATLWNHFSPSADGRHLWMHARLRGEDLPRDATFQLRYVREGS